MAILLGDIIRLPTRRKLMTFYPRLSDVPIVDAIAKYEESDFDEMTKQQLVEVIPKYTILKGRNPVISWARDRILLEVKSTCRCVKDYLIKYGNDLSQLEAGQLCLVGKPGIYPESAPVYIFLGMNWEEEHIVCAIQSLSVCTYASWDSRKNRLASWPDHHAYSEEQRVYPIPKENIVLHKPFLDVLKSAIAQIQPG